MFILWFKPMETKKANMTEVFNDYTLLVLTYFLWCFTDVVSEPETRYILGYVFIGIVLSNLAVHQIVMITKALINLKLKYKRR